MSNEPTDYAALVAEARELLCKLAPWAKERLAAVLMTRLCDAVTTLQAENAALQARVAEVEAHCHTIGEMSAEKICEIAQQRDAALARAEKAETRAEEYKAHLDEAITNFAASEAARKAAEGELDAMEAELARLGPVQSLTEFQVLSGPCQYRKVKETPNDPS